MEHQQTTTSGLDVELTPELAHAIGEAAALLEPLARGSIERHHWPAEIAIWLCAMRLAAQRLHPTH